VGHFAGNFCATVEVRGIHYTSRIGINVMYVGLAVKKHGAWRNEDRCGSD